MFGVKRYYIGAPFLPFEHVGYSVPGGSPLSNAIGPFLGTSDIFSFSCDTRVAYANKNRIGALSIRGADDLISAYTRREYYGYYIGLDPGILYRARGVTDYFWHNPEKSDGRVYSVLKWHVCYSYSDDLLKTYQYLGGTVYLVPKAKVDFPIFRESDYAPRK